MSGRVRTPPPLPSLPGHSAQGRTPVTHPEHLVRTTGRTSMLKGTRSPSPRQKPGRPGHLCLIQCSAASPESWAGPGLGGIPSRLRAGAEGTAGAALRSLNLMGGGGAAPVAPAAAEGATLVPQRPLGAASACATLGCALPGHSPPGASRRSAPETGRPPGPVGRRPRHPLLSAALLHTATLGAASGPWVGERVRPGEVGAPFPASGPPRSSPTGRGREKERTTGADNVPSSAPLLRPRPLGRPAGSRPP